MEETLNAFKQQFGAEALSPEQVVTILVKVGIPVTKAREAVRDLPENIRYDALLQSIFQSSDSKSTSRPRPSNLPDPFVAGIQALFGKNAGKEVVGDSSEVRNKAWQAKDGLSVNPGDGNYDEAMQKLWGGPAPKFFYQALQHPDYQRSFTYQPVALVTGGGAGLGFYISLALAKLGYHVVIPARPGPAGAEARGAEKEILKQVPGAKITVPSEPLDLCSFASVRAFGASVVSSLERLEVLILNAGRGGGGFDPKEVTAADGHEAIMQVNTTSHALLTSILMPLLRKTPGMSRIIYHSSLARFNANKAKATNIDSEKGINAYALSKAAGAVFIKCLNERFLAYGIDNIVGAVADPGLAATGVNIQHDMTKTIGIPGASTADLYELAAHHTADGALPMILAAVTKNLQPNDTFATAGRSAECLKEMAFHLDRFTHDNAKKDPMLEDVWPKELREAVFVQIAKWASIDWEPLLRTLDADVAGASKSQPYVLIYHKAMQQFLGRGWGPMMILEEAGVAYTCKTPEDRPACTFAPPMVITPDGIQCSQAPVINAVLGKSLGLWPKDAAGDAKAMQFCNDGADLLSNAFSSGVERVAKWFSLFESALESSGGPFLFGSFVTAADYGILPALLIASAQTPCSAECQKSGKAAEEFSKYARLSKWCALMREQKGFKAVDARKLPYEWDGS